MDQDKGHHRKWWILSAVTSCLSLIYLDASILPVSLPTIHRDFNTTELALQWIINAYLLSLTVSLLSAGRLCDLFGPKKIFNIGLVLFGLSSIACGLSRNAAMLIIARVIQGMGGAGLMPAAAMILFHAFPVRQRGKAMGLYVSIGSIFLAIGPTVGGLLTEYLSWRYIFWVNLPVVLYGIIMFRLVVPSFPRGVGPFDFKGFVLLGISISCLTLALMESPIWGWGSWMTWSLILASFVTIGLYLRYPQHLHSILDLALFRIPPYIVGLMCMFMGQMVMMVGVYWAVYYQTVLLFPPAQAGYIAFLSNAPLIATAPIAGYMADRFGAKLPVCIGFLLLVFSLTLFFFMPTPKHIWEIACILVPFGCGAPLIFTPSYVGSLNYVGEDKRARAMALFTTVRNLSSTFGMAILGMIFLKISRSHFASLLSENPATQDLNPEVYEGILSKASGSVSALKQLTPNLAQLVSADFSKSYIIAFRSMNFTAMVFALCGFLIACFFLKHKKRSL